jgi:hypothetical protein
MVLLFFSLIIIFWTDLAKIQRCLHGVFSKYSETCENYARSSAMGRYDHFGLIVARGLLAKMPEFNAATNCPSRSPALYVVLDNWECARIGLQNRVGRSAVTYGGRMSSEKFFFLTKAL